MKDPNDLARLEKAIAEKYGQVAIVNPRGLWNEDDEISYQQQLSGSAENKQIKSVEEERDGYNIAFSRLITPERRVCSKCGAYSMSTEDSLYLNKFFLCYKCFLDDELKLRYEGKIK